MECSAFDTSKVNTTHAMDDDGDDKDDSKRRTRNLSEKKRRDQFNLLVNELSSMVSSNNRKMDKSTVLKATIAYLKHHNETTVRSRVHDVQEHWKPPFLTNEEFTYFILEALEGFVMVFSVTGRIHYVSESITSLLGHDPRDIINMSIFDLTYEDDLPNLYNILQNSGNMMDCGQGSSTDELTFQCHLKRGTLDFRDETTYELIQFDGIFRTNVDQNGDGLHYQQDLDSRLFVCTGRLCTPQLIRDVTLVDPNRCEFTSRHSLEWKFLFLDHRASPIIGYLPFEVLGTSGYDYYHFDDLEKVITCHESLMQKGELTSCYYRFLTKGQQWIWLQSRFYITYHQWNSKPQFVVCTHRVVSFADISNTMKKEDTGNMEGMNEEGQTGLKVTSSDVTMTAASPSYMSDMSEPYTSGYQALSEHASVASVSAGSKSTTVATVDTNRLGTPWPRSFHMESDTASVSGESREGPRSSCEIPENAIVPQHGIGTQYLKPAPYVSAVSVPMSSMPVVATSDQAQIQLQRKHQELQQMIVRQQEELRQVKEQLLLARLGMLEPMINLQGEYINSEEIHPNPGEQQQMMYDENSLLRPVGAPRSTGGLEGPSVSPEPEGQGQGQGLGQGQGQERGLGQDQRQGQGQGHGPGQGQGGGEFAGNPPHNQGQHQHMQE